MVNIVKTGANIVKMKGGRGRADSRLLVTEYHHRTAARNCSRSTCRPPF